MVNDLLSRVPAIRGDDQPDQLVLGIFATDRDRRWARHPIRGTLGATFWLCLLGLTWLNLDFLDRSTFVVDLLLIGVVCWWGSGVLGVVLHGERMGGRMAAVVGRSMDVWRSLPDAERERSKVAAGMMLSAGKRHDVPLVRRCVGLFDRLAIEGQSRPNIIAAWELGLTESWADGALEAHRD